MSEEREKIDLLIERNVEDQLARVDWDGLNAAVSGRLFRARQGKTAARRNRRVGRIAAGIAAAAVLVLLVMVNMYRPGGIEPGEGQKGAFKFVESKGRTAVEINQAQAISKVKIEDRESDRKPVVCKVEIIDLNGRWKKDENGGSWIIIKREEPEIADIGFSNDELDIMRLW
jgi:hypothetical protein